jgi:hypothetical protein
MVMNTSAAGGTDENADGGDLLKIEQCSAKGNISKVFLYREIKNGNLKTIRLGRARRVLVSDWHDYLERNRDGAA